MSTSPTSRTTLRGLWLDVAPLAAALRRLTSWPSRETDPHAARLYRAWLRAQERGAVSLRHADEICVRILGLHPVEVYGDDWLDVLDPADEQVAV